MSMLLKDSFTLHILWYWLVFSMVHKNKLGLIEILLYFYTSPNGNIYQSSRTTPSKKRNWKDGCNFSLTYYYPSILYLLYLFYSLSFTHSLTNLIFHSLTNSSLTNSPSHSSLTLLSNSLNYSLTILLIFSLTHLLTLIYSLTYSFTHSPSHWLTSLTLLNNSLNYSLTISSASLTFSLSFTHSLVFTHLPSHWLNKVFF